MCFHVRVKVFLGFYVKLLPFGSTLAQKETRVLRQLGQLPLNCFPSVKAYLSWVPYLVQGKLAIPSISTKGKLVSSFSWGLLRNITFDCGVNAGDREHLHMPIDCLQSILWHSKDNDSVAM